MVAAREGNFFTFEANNTVSYVRQEQGECGLGRSGPFQLQKTARKAAGSRFVTATFLGFERPK